MKENWFLLMLRKYLEALEVKPSSGKWVGIHATSYKEHAIKISISSRDFFFQIMLRNFSTAEEVKPSCGNGLVFT